MDTKLLNVIRSLHVPKGDSHKGQNGRLLLIGGSELFHAASLWSLTIASRLVDLVHYCSVDENNEIVQRAKEEFRNGIVIRRSEVRSYVEEDDCILIGPGMTRDSETYSLTNDLVSDFPDKQWVIDAGALQMIDVQRIPKHAILTPHHKEFVDLWRRLIFSSFGPQIPEDMRNGGNDFDCAEKAAKILDSIILLKGKEDFLCSSSVKDVIPGGNGGMTKGGTGDVLAGLISALACKNDPYAAALAGSVINKAAGDELYSSVGPFFNASDLANQIPKTMARLLL